MINENYKFIPSKKIIIFRYFIYPFILIYCKCFMGFKVTGKENIEQLQTGAITVSNHVHFMDNALIYFALFPKMHYFVTNKINIETSFVRFFVRGLGGIPVPKSKRAMKSFIDSLNRTIQEGTMIHFFPEGSIKSYHPSIRHFNDGPFRLAVQNKVPVIPFTFVYQKPTGIWKYIKQKPLIHLIISEPIVEITEYQTLKMTIQEHMKKIISTYSS